MKRPKTFAFHGFWGRGSDFGENFEPIHRIDLYKYCHLSWDELAAQIVLEHDFSDSLLLGYSMGGRVLLNCLTHLKTESIRGAVFLATNPGLKDEAARAQRRKEDLAWAEAFRHEEWKKLCETWDSRPVFSGDSKVRLESEWDRSALAQCMENWSLGHQPDYRPFLRQLKLPALWLNGEYDQKFLQIHREIESFSRIRCRVLRGVGHRLLNDPEQVVNHIEEFLS